MPGTYVKDTVTHMSLILGLLWGDGRQTQGTVEVTVR